MKMLKLLGACAQADGERLPLVVKDLGSCDLYPATLAHSPNGRFVAVCGARQRMPPAMACSPFVSSDTADSRNPFALTASSL